MKYKLKGILLDLSACRKGPDANSHIRLATLREVHTEGLKTKRRPRQLNCLALPGTSGVEDFRPNKLFTHATAVNVMKNKAHFKKLAPADEAYFWHLVATIHTSHPAHVDENGFATLIAPQIGVKIVFLLLPAVGFPSMIEALGNIKFTELGHGMENSVGMVPFMVILRYPDRL